MNKIYFIILSIAALINIHCGSDNPVINNDPGNTSDYTKIYTSEMGVNKFEVYSKSSSNFIYGYNELGFKVFINGSEQNSGFVKFKPTMYHGIGGPSHSIPVSPSYTWNSGENLFTGYAVFIMYDTAAFWAADLNFNDQVYNDSNIITTNYSSRTQILGWDNTITEKTYFLTMISPSAPRVGMNELELMLHQTGDMTNYEEVNNAEMMIRPWMESMNHGSPNNVNPAYISPGRYKGSVNFTMSGEWYLYDSIKVDGNFITRTPTPKFIMQVN